MNNDRTPRIFAFVLSVVMTLAIFSGVTALSSPDHAGQLLVRVNADESRG